MNISLVVPPEQKAAYLQTLPAIRERCSRVHGKALQGKLHRFEYLPEKEDQAVDFCIDIIRVCYYARIFERI
jgi:hypothetical protein